MKRIEKVYNYLNKVCSSYSRENLDKCMGVSAQEIGNELGILRNNVSKELNDLCRDKRAIKIKCRPVRYLKTQVEQAKAAIMYPPNGLHTLIVGPTGVGKSLFANIMYSYAKYIGKLDENSPFIVFNCADYYNNPQLLLSYIFGHVKGAFTGADSDKEGIVEKANGGILFLDEIHRLPPEGQEMIFYFMDTGTFNKLGETERKRKGRSKKGTGKRKSRRPSHQICRSRRRQCLEFYRPQLRK